MGIWFITAYFPQLEREKSRSFDFFGFLCMGIGLASLLYFFDVLISPDVSVHLKWAAAMVFSICALTYLWHASRIEHPIISGALWHIQRFRVMSIASLVMRLSLSSMPFLMPLFLQTSLGWSAFQAGMMFIPVALGSMLSKQCVVFIVEHFSEKPRLILNGLGSSLTMMVLAESTLHFHPVIVLLALFLNGFFGSNQYNMMNTAAYSVLENKLLSEGSTIYSMIIQVGMSFGIALAGMLMITLVGHANLSMNLPAWAFNRVIWIGSFIPFCAMFLFTRVHPNEHIHGNNQH